MERKVFWVLGTLFSLNIFWYIEVLMKLFKVEPVIIPDLIDGLSDVLF